MSLFHRIHSLLLILAALSLPAAAHAESTAGATRLMLTGTVGNMVDGDTFQLNHAGGVTEVTTGGAWPDLFQPESQTTLKTGMQVSALGMLDAELLSGKRFTAQRLIVSGEEYDRVYTQPHYQPAPSEDISLYPQPSQGSNYMESPPVYLAGTVDTVREDGMLELLYDDGALQVDVTGADIPNAAGISDGDSVVIIGKMDGVLFRSQQVTAKQVILARSAGNAAH